MSKARKVSYNQTELLNSPATLHSSRYKHKKFSVLTEWWVQIPVSGTN